MPCDCPNKCTFYARFHGESAKIHLAAGKSCYLRATCQVKFPSGQCHPMSRSRRKSPHLGLGGEVHQSNTSASWKWIPNRWQNSCTMVLLCLPKMESGTFLWLLGSHVIDLRCCQHGEPARVTVECLGSVHWSQLLQQGGYRKNGSRWDFTRVWSVSNIQTIF